MRIQLTLLLLAILVAPVVSAEDVLSGDFTVRGVVPGPLGQFTDHIWLVREKGVLTLYAGDDRRGYRTIGTAKAAGPIDTRQLPVWIGTLSPNGRGRVVLGWCTTEAVHPTRKC